MKQVLQITAVVAASILPTASTAEWTGGYAGLSVGTLLNGEIDGEDGIDATIDGDMLIGAFAGYQTQIGDLVFGGELAVSHANDFEAQFGEEVLPRDFRLIDVKARAGYNFDDVLVYGTAGFSQITAFGDIDGEDTAEGFNIGIGASYQVNDQLIISAEYLARRLTLEEDDISSDVIADTLSLRAAFGF